MAQSGISPSTSNDKIDQAEAALYDRQIRLWGVETQQRLRQAKIMVVGMRTLALEVCKNLVLAGVGTLLMVDDGKVTEDDLCGNFLLSEDDLGKNRAEAVREGLQGLNPRVHIVVDATDIASKPEDFFTSLTAVVLTCASSSLVAKVDDACRRANANFFYGEIYGFCGFFFSDLGVHHYLLKGEKESKDKEETLSFCSFRQAMISGPDTRSPKRERNTSWLYCGMQALHQFQDEEGRLPHHSSSNDIDKACNIAEKIVAGWKAPQDTVLPTDMRQLAIGATVGFSSTAAIVGGLMAQEVLKSVSGVDKPLANFFFYDGFNTAGTVEAIGM